MKSTLCYVHTLIVVCIVYALFNFSNSKILDREFGYWAEQIPTTDSPMCAVVDPLRDYRWHSLRCGGPDVAAFLCEMEGSQQMIYFIWSIYLILYTVYLPFTHLFIYLYHPFVCSSGMGN